MLAIEDPQSTRHSQVTHCYFEGCRYYTPLYSDPPLGRYDWTRVIDITTGQEHPHVYNGGAVRLPADAGPLCGRGAAQGERDRAAGVPAGQARADQASLTASAGVTGFGDR